MGGQMPRLAASCAHICLYAVMRTNLLKIYALLKYIRFTYLHLLICYAVLISNGINYIFAADWNTPNNRCGRTAGGNGDRCLIKSYN